MNRHSKTYTSSSSVVQAVLDAAHDIDIDAVSKDGLSALHYAVVAGEIECIKVTGVELVDCRGGPVAAAAATALFASAPHVS